MASDGLGLKYTGNAVREDKVILILSLILATMTTRVILNMMTMIIIPITNTVIILLLSYYFSFLFSFFADT